MEYDIKILTERIDELEHRLTEAHNTIGHQKKQSEVNIVAFQSTFLFFLPVIALVFVFMGLNVNYQSDNHQISYTNNNLSEITLTGLTLVSGLYSLKKHRDKQRLERDNS